MNKKLLAELKKIDDVEFFTLEHHLWMARLIRNTMKERGLSNLYMSKILGISAQGLKAALNGAYPFDLRMMSKIQSYRQQEAANDAKFKIEAEGIQFTEYKHQFPIYVERLTRLLEILEKQNQPEK